MRLFRHLDELPEKFCHGAVAIGKFDGVHLGHARIVARLLEVARNVPGPAVAFTFDPPPAAILWPDEAPPPLCWIERKAHLLGELGVDAVVACPTDQAFLQLEARAFFDRILRGCLDARALVEGPDFCFGHRRTGTIERLREFCDEVGIVLEVVDRVEVDGEAVSSSRVRALVSAGRVEEVRALLTQPYRIRGSVVRGAGRGANLGYPTANVGWIETLLPGAGVYAGRAWIRQSPWTAAIHVGPNPTFGEGTRKVEVHLIGFHEALYDQAIEVDFLARLRDIKRFDALSQLTAQMKRDVGRALQIVQRDDVPRQRP